MENQLVAGRARRGGKPRRDAAAGSYQVARTKGYHLTMTAGTAYAKARGYWIGRGKTNNLYVHPKTKVRVAGSASFDIDGSFRLGPRGYFARFIPSFALFGRNSRTTVTGDFAILTDFSLIVDEGAELVLGSGHFNTGSRILCRTRITIGSACLFGPEVAIRDDDAHYFGDTPKSAPITIEDHVWVGMRSTILKGVTIGEGSVIAAGSVVTSDVPPHSLAGGVPARVIKKEVSWRE
jgi:Bacterial transferase hexapeptide (six repeats)